MQNDGRDSHCCSHITMWSNMIAFKWYRCPTLCVYVCLCLYAMAYQADGYFRCMRLSVRPSVCSSVRKLNLFCTITRHRFDCNDHICTKRVAWDIFIRYWTWGHWLWPPTSIWPLWLAVKETRLVAIAHQRFGLGSQNLHSKCTLWYSWLVLKMGVIYPGLQSHFGRFDSEF